jgi:ribosomal protein S18 acetylase RimI-like enzyme
MIYYVYGENMMINIEIKALSKELVDDYLEFFDNIAFSDHKEWSYCYCATPYFDKSSIEKFISMGKENLRDEAKALINENILQGYLAYEENNVIGWCNCGNKINYKHLRNELWDINDKNFKIKSIVCFTIAPDMRGKGIATRLLDRICSDVKEEPFSCLEAYPIKGEGNCFAHYGGPYKLYENKGFNVYKEFEKDMIVRKYRGDYN